VVDLVEIAARLDAEEQFTVKYRFPVRIAGGHVKHETREDKLLDVAEEAGLIYVSHHGEILWIKLEEVLEVIPEA